MQDENEPALAPAPQPARLDEKEVRRLVSALTGRAPAPKDGSLRAHMQRVLAVGSWRYNSILVPGIQWRGVRMRVKVMVRARGEDAGEGYGEG